MPPLGGGGVCLPDGGAGVERGEGAESMRGGRTEGVGGRGAEVARGGGAEGMER